jgi:nuclear pore complex protein Nup160
MFSQLALSVAPPDTDTTGLWTNVIKGNIALGLFDDAYAALIVSPYEKLYVTCRNYPVAK